MAKNMIVPWVRLRTNTDNGFWKLQTLKWQNMVTTIFLSGFVNFTTLIHCPDWKTEKKCLILNVFINVVWHTNIEILYLTNYSIQHALTRASAVIGRPLATWDMAWPTHIHNNVSLIWPTIHLMFSTFRFHSLLFFPPFTLCRNFMSTE
jgi:hypothetical protein